MKIILDFEDDEKEESRIPFDAKLRIIKGIMKAAHNPAEFVTLEMKPFKVTDK